jgi:hypothetical protein
VRMGRTGHGKRGGRRVVCLRCGEIGDAVMRDGSDEGCCKVCVEAGWSDAIGLRVVKSRGDGVVAGGSDEMGLVARQGFVDDVRARSTRCQRCWAFDHTLTRAVRCSGNQLLCGLCWERNEGGGK